MINMYTEFSILLTLAVGLGYVNHRFIGLQTTIAIMMGSLIISLLLIAAGMLGFHHLQQETAGMLSKIDFHALLMQGMISYLLFAGALTIDLNALKQHKWEITILATAATIASTLLVGALSYYLLRGLGIQTQLIYCMLFGALISPTDPIAVLATFKEVNAPKSLSTIVSGESLFNDGVGIVIFLTLYSIAFSKTQPTWESVSLLFLQQSIGGMLYGALLGYITYRLLKPIDDHKIEILLTLATVTGGYALAQYIGVSGPLAMVVAGIFIGNQGRVLAMSGQTRRNLTEFWELVDEILNAILFLLIGLEFLVLPISTKHFTAMLIAIPLVLAIRFLTVYVPISTLKIWRSYYPHTINIMVWGGLRGGLAVALALSLPQGEYREIILAMTYAIVAFAVIVQGITVKPLVTLSKKSGTST